MSNTSHSQLAGQGSTAGGLPRAKRLAVLVVTLLLVWAAECRAQYSFTTNQAGLTLTQYCGPGGEIILPAHQDGLAVVEIAPHAFAYSTTIVSVQVPDSVSLIGRGSFSDCIGLTNVTLGKGILDIGDKAFYNCVRLSTMVLPNSLTNIGAQAFYGCSGLRTLVLPNSLACIGWEAFSWCTRLASVAIPAGTTNVGDYAFHACSSLSVIDVDPLNPSFSSLAGVLFDKSGACLLQCPGAKAGTYVIPNAVKRIASSAFVNCNSLTNISIPGNVTNIGDSAFSFAATLTALNVDPLNSFYSSLGGALYDKEQTTLLQCAAGALGTFELPPSVTNIGTTAFMGCKRLTAITVDPSNPAYTSLAGVLFNKEQSTVVQCPAGLGDSYIVPQGVSRIRDYAFVGCSSLTNVVLPTGITEIGLAAFAACSGITRLVIPDSVTSIGPEAFEDCTGLNAVVLGNSLTNLGVCAFYQCTALSSVSIPDSLTRVPERVFESCTSLTRVTIGKNVTNIGSLAFGFCTNLASVYFSGNAPSLESAALGEGTLTVYFLPGKSGWQTTFGGFPAILWNAQPQTRPPNFGIRANGFSFNISGTSNIVVVVEACTDPASSSWSALQTNELIGGSATFEDPQWSNYPARFYRIRRP